jgi:CYTH domain-containing protein
MHGEVTMAKEIERKFLVRGDEWRHGSSFERCCQGYLISESDCNVRIRTLGDHAYITIKGKAEGITRLEYEYEIPFGDAEEMLNRLCIHPLIMKRRFTTMFSGVKWQVDEFMQENEGLILAEIELISENQHIHLPPWVGDEVTHDSRYYNRNLVKNPYSKWVMSID